MTKGELAESLFKQGLNCSQAVAVAFADEIGMDSKTAAQLTLAFGGGLGRLREVCGTVTGMAFVLSGIYKNDDKTQMYKRVQETAEQFRRINGSIICRELLGISPGAAPNPQPDERTAEYYQKRPCPKLAAISADILEEYLKNHPV